MAFQVELTRRAANDIEDIFHYIAVDSDAPMNAVRWRSGLEKQLYRLTFLAGSMPFAEENRHAPCEVRQMLFGKFRILYTVQTDVVIYEKLDAVTILPVTAYEVPEPQ